MQALDTIKRYILYGVLIFLLIKLPSIIFHTNVCIDCLGEDPTFHLHWREPGVDYIEARCYKSDFQYLQYLNQCRQASQDTVFNIGAARFIKNTRNFPNHAGADEQDWDYIANQNTLIYFYFGNSGERHALEDIVIEKGFDLRSLFREYSIRTVEQSKNEISILIEGNYSSLDLNELRAFYEWCKTQSYHQKASTCTYRLLSSKNSKQTMSITYHERGEFFHLDIP